MRILYRMIFIRVHILFVEKHLQHKNLNDLRFVNTGNFEEGNNDFANNFLMKYTRELGGADSAEDKGLIHRGFVTRKT